MQNESKMKKTTKASLSEMKAARKHDENKMKAERKQNERDYNLGCQTASVLLGSAKI